MARYAESNERVEDLEEKGNRGVLFSGMCGTPSVLPDISPPRGEIDSLQRPAITKVEDEMSGYIFPISPLEGEMPGRAEGGKLRTKSKTGSSKPYRFNSQVVTRSPVSLSLPSFN